MNNMIIGTAGHVDHGKTLLIKALTGIDTDRLKEEKRRGITIEPGFAYLSMPNGQRAGIIDVPGHEKFIKNMLAGAGSIDIALLVIAADEGVMPQTREHLGILSLLDIKRGVIALTKTDLVAREMLDTVKLEIQEELAGTFLADAPVLPVSAVTGDGIETLRHCLLDILLHSPEKACHTPFRLPIDRVFKVDGFGTVVTGTLIEGSLSTGCGIMAYPSMTRTRARGLQVHGEAVQTASAGQRVAVNLGGISHAEPRKGDVLAAEGSMQNSLRLDVRLDVLPYAGRELLHGSRLHLCHGTRDLLCRLYLLNRQRIAKGEHAYAQLCLSEPLAARTGDRFVLRFYSPLETVGGGVILDPNPQRRPRNDRDSLRGFEIKEKGSLGERIARMVLERSAGFPAISVVRTTLFRDDPCFDSALESLLQEGVLLRLGENRVIHRDFLNMTGVRCQKLLEAYHNGNPLRKGMRRDELSGRVFPEAEAALSGYVIDLLSENKIIKLIGNYAANPGFDAAMGERHRRVSGEVTRLLLGTGYTTPSYDELASRHVKDRKLFKQAFDALVADGTVVMLTPQICIHKAFYESAFKTFTGLAEERGPVTLAEFRDGLKTTRRYAVALLEHFDRKGMTKKVGDARKPT